MSMNSVFLIFLLVSLVRWLFGYTCKNNNFKEFTVFTTVKRLEEPYHLCVAHEDMDKALHLCRIFTELAETFLTKMINFDPQTPHFALTILDSILVCCGHPDYEIPDITFNFWYR